MSKERKLYEGNGEEVMYNMYEKMLTPKEYKRLPIPERVKYLAKWEEVGLSRADVAEMLETNVANVYSMYSRYDVHGTKDKTAVKKDMPVQEEVMEDGAVLQVHGVKTPMQLGRIGEMLTSFFQGGTERFHVTLILKEQKDEPNENRTE